MEDNKKNVSHDQQPPLPPTSLETEKEGDRQVPCHMLDQVVYVPDLKNHPFPISRVKRIMRSDPHVVMASADAPVLLAKACEMFLADLTNRAWLNAREKKRNMIRKPDVIDALTNHEPCDFLLDLFPKEEPIQPVAPSESVAPSDSIAPSDFVDITDAIDFTDDVDFTDAVDDFTNMIQQPDYVMGVPAYCPPPSGHVMGTPVVYPVWPPSLSPEARGGADEAGPNGTANDGGN